MAKEELNVPTELRYTAEHEWVSVKGDIATVGITDYAQSQLGDIVYVETPGADDEATKGNAIGSVESVKSVSDIYAPVSGTIVEVNEVLSDSPEQVNEDPYGEGWMFRIQLSDKAELDDLLKAKEYVALIRGDHPSAQNK